MADFFWKVIPRPWPLADVLAVHHCSHCLPQALWKNYLDNGFEYLSIQDQVHRTSLYLKIPLKTILHEDFDVPDSTLGHLVSAGIVKHHPSDRDRVKMEDFTCRD